MSNFTRTPHAVNPAPARDWPAWTDEDVWELGPDPEPSDDDRAWWAEECERVEEAEEARDLEDRYQEGLATDRLTRGYCLPPDVAEALVAASLIGHRP